MTKRVSAALVLALAVASGPARAADEEVPLYTNADLDRMFGKSEPTAPSGPPSTTAEQDWHRVESFLDREYARLDAERKYELERRALREAPPQADYYNGYAAWGLGYPASTWWYGVSGAYARGTYGGSAHGAQTTVDHPRQRMVHSSQSRLHGSAFRVQSGGFRGHAR
jgi:hypothetical protein